MAPVYSWDLCHKIEETNACFLFEVDFTEEEKQKVIDFFQEFTRCSPENLMNNLKQWGEEHTVLNLILLTEIARRSYNAERKGFWPNFFENFQIENRSSYSQGILGQAFLRGLRRFHLKTEVPLRYEYVGRILAHAGLPEACYQELIGWLLNIEPDLSLTYFAEMSCGDFLQTVSWSKKQPQSNFLNNLLSSDEGKIMLWSLASLIGECASLVEKEHSCPWSEGFRYRLFHSIKDFYSGKKLVKKIFKQIGADPRIYWDIGGQVIIIYLPEQRLPSGFTLKISGALGEGKALPGRQREDCFLMDEIRSKPLGPSDKIYAQVDYIKNGQTRKSKEIEIADEAKEVIFFNSVGLVLKSDVTSPPGEYLMLIKKSVQESFFLKDVQVIDELIEPAGWWDFRGYRVSISSGISIGGYHFEQINRELNWSLIVIQNQDVNIISSIPVLIDDWPEVIIRDIAPDVLENALLEVELNNNYHQLIEIFTLNIGSVENERTDIYYTEMPDGEGIKLSFQRRQEGNLLCGLFSIRLLLQGRNYRRSRQLEFIRLKGIKMQYHPGKDEYNSLDNNISLCLEGAKKIIPLEKTKVLQNQQEWLIYPEEPLKSPEVYFRLETQDNVSIALRVRIPVNRICLLNDDSTVMQWQELPLEISLADISHNDKIRLELITRPSLVNEELHCRLVYGQDMIAGKPYFLPNTFEIPLHRWHDGLGCSARGIIQVHILNKWTNMVNLTGEGIPLLPEPHESITEETYQAIRNLDWLKLQEVAARALNEIKSKDCPASLKDIYMLAAARANFYLGDYQNAEGILEPLQERKDLPEGQLYLLQAKLRQSGFESSILNEFSNLIQNRPDFKEKDLIWAELNFRLSARSMNKSESALQESRRLLKEMTQADEFTRVEAALIDGIIAFFLNAPQGKYTFPQNRFCSCCQEILDLITYNQKYLNTSLNMWAPDREIKQPDLTLVQRLRLWSPQDIEYLELVFLQASGRKEKADHYLRKLINNGGFYYGLELLQARQNYLSGEKEKARHIYRQILDKYPLVFDEISLVA